MYVLAPVDPETALTASEAADKLGFTVEAILNWVRRGHLKQTGIDAHGHKTYRWIDVIRAERDTRQRALGGRGRIRR